uniref:Putative antitoxin n=1 Tax=viral metagenome TaxID=1070528 RepID=A0A6H1ZSG1_9ZZZZ
MSKTIKVEEKVYNRLDQLRGKRETFSDVVDKLLTTKEGVDTMLLVWHNQYGERDPREK